MMCASDPRHEDTSPPPPCSEEECPPRKLTSKCSTSKTRTPLTSLNGSQTTSSQLFAISHQRDSRWPLPSLVTPPPSKRCSRESENNSPPCSEERLSSIGTPEKVWTRWSSPRPSPTRTISFPSINNIKMPPPKTRRKWT